MAEPTTPEDARSSVASALEWSFNPWRDRPRAAFAALGFAIGIALLVATLAEPPVVRLGLGLAAVAALLPMLVPARCRVDGDGVSRRDPLGTAHRRWTELKREPRRINGRSVYCVAGGNS